MSWDFDFREIGDGYQDLVIDDVISVFPQIAIAIGVLTSNRGGRRRTTLADWTWHQGAIAGCSGRGAIAGCHRTMVGGEGDDQLWGSGHGAIAGCRCSVPWLGEGRVTANFGGILGEWTWCHCWVSLQGAIVVCYGGRKGR